MASRIRFDGVVGNEVRPPPRSTNEAVSQDHLINHPRPGVYPSIGDSLAAGGSVPPDVAKFSEYRGRGEIIDHIFASHTLVTNDPPTVATMYPVGTPMPSIDDNPNTLRNLPGSDHAAVLATFTV
jgi:hypothetical protein